MPADVVESAQLAVIATRGDDRLSGEVRGEEAAFVLHLTGAADDLPCFREYAALLEFVDAGVEVPRGRNRPGVIQRIIRIVEIQQVSDVSLHVKLLSALVVHVIPRNAVGEKGKESTRSSIERFQYRNVRNAPSPHRFCKRLRRQGLGGGGRQKD